MKWSEDQTYRFVKIYLKHVNLWDSTDEKYKAKNLRMKSHREIISEFMEATGIELNVVELKIKIKNLRSTYIQELAKIKRRSSPSCPYRSSLKWFMLWHKHLANKKKDIETFNQQKQINSSEVWVSETNNLDTNADPFEDNEDFNMIPKVEPNESYKHDSVSQCKATKAKMNIRCPSVEFSENTFRGSMDSSDLLKEDEFDIYGKYIASQLRKIDLQKALRVQLDIQSLMSEARMSQFVSKH